MSLELPDTEELAEELAEALKVPLPPVEVPLSLDLELEPPVELPLVVLRVVFSVEPLLWLVELALHEPPWQPWVLVEPPPELQAAAKSARGAAMNLCVPATQRVFQAQQGRSN